VALKEYLPAALAGRRPDGEIAVRSELFYEPFSAGLRSFINESRLLARFDHPSLVKVHRFWEANGTAYMVMPFYEGVTLKQVRQSMTAPPEEAWLRRILDALLGALEVMHTASVYHRDVAPDNILLLRSGVPVLLDFGAARHVLAEQTQTITAMLKPAYAPIEQYADALEFRQGPWTDIYATAATLHYCLTGKAPLTAIARTVHETYEPLHERLDLRDPPEGHPYEANWLAALDWALEVKPQARPQSIAQWKDALSGKVPAPRRAATAQPLVMASARPLAVPEYYATAMTPQEYFPTTVAAALRRIPAANAPQQSTTAGAHALFSAVAQSKPASKPAQVTPIGHRPEAPGAPTAREDADADPARHQDSLDAAPVLAQVVVLTTHAHTPPLPTSESTPEIARTPLQWVPVLRSLSDRAGRTLKAGADDAAFRFAEARRAVARLPDGSRDLAAKLRAFAGATAKAANGRALAFQTGDAVGCRRAAGRHRDGRCVRRALHATVAGRRDRLDRRGAFSGVRACRRARCCRSRESVDRRGGEHRASDKSHTSIDRGHGCGAGRGNTRGGSRECGAAKRARRLSRGCHSAR
jgi:hypothetical protein